MCDGIGVVVHEKFVMANKIKWADGPSPLLQIPFATHDVVSVHIPPNSPIT